jgi:LuxR family maltose regulon positive regulatory protein
VLQRLQHLLDDAPANVHIVLLTRTAPQLDLARLRMDGRVLEFTARDLSLDEQEIDAFIADSRLALLPPADRRRLIDRSAGWVAGLQIAVHSLPLTPDAADAQSALVDAADRWTELLEREMFAQLAPELLQFLVGAALLPYLDADLCAAVFDRTPTECAALLRRSADATSFLTRYPVGHDSAVYRIHPILKSALLQHLQTVLPAAEIQRMRRTATAWLAQHEQVDAALSLLLPNSAEESIDTADAEFAADLLERACRPALLRADLTAVKRWISRLPESLVRRRPRLALEAAWAALHSLDPQLRTRLVQLQESITHASERGSHTAEEILSEAATLQALCAAFEGSFAQLERALQVAARIPAAPGSIADAYLHTLRAYHIGADKRGSDARIAELYTAFDIFGRAGFTRGQVEAASLAGVIASIDGDGERPVEEFTRAVDFIRLVGWERSSFGINTHLWFADSLYTRHRIAEAREHLHRAIALASATSAADLVRTHAEIYLQMCDLAEGRDIADTFDTTIDDEHWRSAVRHSSPRHWAATAYLRVVRDLRMGRLDACWRTIDELGLTPDRLDPSAVPSAVLAGIGGALFSGRDVAGGARILTAFLSRLAQTDYPTMRVRAQILQAVHSEITGHSAKALHQMRELLPLVEHMQLLRMVADLPQLRPLLARCEEPFARRLLDLMGTPAAAHHHPFQLTKQELRVLRMLAETLTTHDIAAALHITVDTVRKHLKSCYRKMNVHSQIAAIQAARDAGLLS